MTTHLVLGASGFLGQELCLRLLSEGSSVIGVDVLPTPLSHSAFTFMSGDIRTLEFTSLFSPVSIIHHCASLVPLAGNETTMTSVNVDGTKHLLEVLSVLRWDLFIYYSSSSVTGFHGEAVGEEVKPMPVEAYGASKLAAEVIVQNFCEQKKLPWVIVRPRTILGRGRLGLFELLFSWILRNKTVFLPGPGEVPFQMIHIDDLLDGIQIILAKNGRGLFHIAGEPSARLKDDLTDLIRLNHSSSQLLTFPKVIVEFLKILSALKINPFAPWQYLAFNQVHLLDTTKLRRLGWKPRFSNLQMLQDSFQTFKHERHDQSERSLHKRPLNLLKFGFLR